LKSVPQDYSVGFPARLIKNAVSQRITELEDRHAPQEEVLRAASGMRGEVYGSGKADQQAGPAGRRRRLRCN
jgi:NAD(P)H-dependent flavin oxidoreductase YrpB (nitropropane dioxygenase family)